MTCIEYSLQEYIDIRTDYDWAGGRSGKTNIIFYILNPILFIILVAVLSLVLTNSNDASAPRQLFGYSAMTILTHSMDDVYPQHSLIIVKKLDPETVQVGDDITFLRKDNVTATHRVINIYENYNDWGMRGFQTKGTNNPAPDVEIVAAKNIVGKVLICIPKLGIIIKTIRANIIMTAVLLALFVVFLNILGRVIRELM
jgi:signal peptidase